MKNFVQSGDLITVTSPSGGVTSGDGVIVGSLFGVAASSMPAGGSVTLSTRGVYDLPKTTTSTFTSGTVVSFDISLKKCRNSGSGLYPIGVAVADAAGSAAKVRVRLDGVSTKAAG